MAYQFNIYIIDTVNAQNCIIHVDNRIYFVHIEGNFIGSMIKDSASAFGFATENQELSPLIEEISGNIQQASLRAGFPEVNKAVWGENIKGTEFINEETLVVLLHEETDLIEFGGLVGDVITDYVEFDEHLNLVLTKPDSEETYEIGINQR